MGELIDTDDLQFQPSKVGMKSFDYVCKVAIDSMPGVDIEDLDTVKSLREENTRLKEQVTNV